MLPGRRLFNKLTEIRERRRFQKRISRALKLRARGAVANDGLPLKKLSSRLEVEWCARGIQPWDRDLPVEQQTKLFVEQCLNDTVVAIRRMFERMAEIDIIDIRVVEPERPEATVLAGTVLRDDVNAARRHTSPSMNLKVLGVRYHVTDGGFEPLP
jgi:hypothetical protein